MQADKHPITGSYVPEDDVIDLKGLILPLWRGRRKLIIAGAVGAVVMVLGMRLSATYVSDALFQMPNVSFSSYKLYASLLADENRFEQYVKDNQLENKASIERLAKILGSEDALKKVAQPVFALTPKDAKDFVPSKDAAPSGAILGIRFSISGDDPRENQQTLSIMGDFMRDNIAYIDVSKSSTAECANLRVKLDSLQISAIDNKLTYSQNLERIQQWEGVIQDMPDSDTIARFIQFFGSPNPANRTASAGTTAESDQQALSTSPPVDAVGTTTVTEPTLTNAAGTEAASAETTSSVTVQGSSERFLSPIAQLIAVKSRNKELELASERRERDRLESEINAQIYCQLAQATKVSSSGKKALATFDALQEQVFKSADMNNPTVERAKLNLNKQREIWHNRYSEELRFLSEPALAKEPTRKLGTVMAAALGGFLGLFFGAIVLWIREWWRNSFSAADFAD